MDTAIQEGSSENVDENLTHERAACAMFAHSGRQVVSCVKVAVS